MGIRTVTFIDGMKPGLGFNRLTGDVLSTPAVSGPSSVLANAKGQEVTLDCTILQDAEALHKAIGITVDAGGSYMGFSGSSKTNYASSFDFSSFSMYVVIRCTVINAVETMDSPVLIPEASELLMAKTIRALSSASETALSAASKEAANILQFFRLPVQARAKKSRLLKKYNLLLDHLLYLHTWALL